MPTKKSERFLRRDSRRTTSLPRSLPISDADFGAARPMRMNASMQPSWRTATRSAVFGCTPAISSSRCSIVARPRRQRQRRGGDQQRPQDERKNRQQKHGPYTSILMTWRIQKNPIVCITIAHGDHHLAHAAR